MPDHPHPRTTRQSRPAFTLVIAPLILGITLVILGVIYAVQHQTPLVPNGPRPLSIKVATAATAIASWFLVLASGWAEKRSHKSANIVFGSILLLFNLAMLNAVTGWSASMRARSSPPPVVPPVAIAPTTSAAPSLPTSVPSAPTPLDQQSQSRTTTDTSAPANSPTPRRASRPPSPPATSDFDFEPLAAQLTTDLKAELAARAADAAAVYRILEKPRHDRKQLDEQMATLATLKESLSGFAQRLRLIDSEFAEAAEKAGASRAAALSRAISFSRGFQSFERSVACDSIARACERGTELLTILRDNITKWTFTTKGEITTKDKTLEHQLFAPKAQVGFALNDKDKNISTLKAD